VPSGDLTSDTISGIIPPSSKERLLPPETSELARAFYAEAKNSRFPYDIGDDPAFFSARFYDGPVTWGVCRADVRCATAVGDWIVFFSCETDDHDQLGPVSTVTRYRFEAALCIETKLQHTSLFEPQGNMLGSYLNLLVRPNGPGWEHFEPALHPSKRLFYLYEDWTWRICCRSQVSRKADLIAQSHQHVAGQPLSFGGRPLPVVENYIVFSRALSVLVDDPPLVATYRRGEVSEKWESDPQSRRLRELVFAGACRGLRTRNRQQPHRHFVRRLDDGDWPNALREALTGN
jgi:hypothetical protein